MCTLAAASSAHVGAPGHTEPKCEACAQVDRCWHHSVICSGYVSLRVIQASSVTAAADMPGVTCGIPLGDRHVHDNAAHRHPSEIHCIPCNTACPDLQAQTALAAGNCSLAADLLKDALRTAVPDDWAAYVLLFGCSLPRTAWPCEHAGNGIIGVEGGVGHLRGRLLQQDFWHGLSGPEAEADVQEVVADLQAFLASVINLVSLTTHMWGTRSSRKFLGQSGQGSGPLFGSCLQ